MSMVHCAVLHLTASEISSFFFLGGGGGGVGRGGGGCSLVLSSLV